jgi:hypothetical protein
MASVRALWRRLPAWLRRVLRLLILALPFALFFGFQSGEGWPAYVLLYKVCLVFVTVTWLAVAANERWVVPRLAPGHGRAGRREIVKHTASYTVAAVLGAALSAVLVRLFMIHRFMGNARSVMSLLLYTLLFAALSIGIAYAFHFHGAYMDRVREEERFQARVEHEMRTAAAIQQALMPMNRPVAPLFDVAGAALPGRTISGDFLDYFELPGGRLAFVLGDVAGKGPASALVAATIQGMFSAVSESEERPADAIRRVNRALVSRAVQSKFATVFHGLLTADGSLYACNAGHNPPLLLRAAGGSEWLTTGGLLLGVFDQAIFEEQPARLAPGDTLVLFSDGVSEAVGPGGAMYGEERILSCLEAARRLPAAGVLDRLLVDVQTFAAGEPQADDITVLVVRYAGDGT